MADIKGRIICSYCKDVIQDDIPGFSGDTHGVCTPCYEKALKQIRKDQEEWKKRRSIQQH